MSKLRVNEIEPFSGPAVAIGGPPTANPSAIFDVQSTDQGILFPRMTTAQRNAIASPVEGLLIYNLDDGRLEQYTSGQWTVAGNGLTPVMNVLRVIKNPVLNSGDFSSITAALASISTNGPTNQYCVEVGPGVYVENPIHMKPYVYIKGQDFDATVIQANDPTEHLIFAADFSSISNCVLTGLTLAGKALVYYASTTGTLQTAFWASNIRFGSADILGIADGTLAHSNLFVVDSRFGATYQFNTGFVAKTSGVPFGRVILRNCTTSKMTAPFPVDMFVVDGVGCELHLNSVIARTGTFGGGGNGARARNGGFLRFAGGDLDGFTTGIWIENVGTAPTLVAMATLLNDNITDIKIDHAGTKGGLTAGGENDLILVSVVTPNFGYVLTDGNILISGQIKQTQPDGGQVDISTLTRDTASLGLLDSSGDINPPVSGLTVTVEAGFGYLKTATDSLRKITWPDTPLTLPANAIRYMYFDENSVLQTSAVLPSGIQNIILGRAVTNATRILALDESGIQATHASNKLSDALRFGLGAVYSNGSIVSELGTRTLNVSAGSYYYGELHFEANGGSPITFTSFYQNGTGGFVDTGGQTVVDNAFWDDGTGTLAAIGAGNYAKHSLYALGDSTGDFDSEAYYLVYSQAQYTALTLAEQGSLPSPPPFMDQSIVPIASIIVKQGTTNIVEFLDERPISSARRASVVSAASFHSGLLGLTVGDDHPQYWRNDGTHLATGDFNLNTHALTNVTTVNSVVVENHHARHQPGSGLDELPTAAASTLTPDLANAVGVSTSLSRADHIHNIPTAVASGLNANSTSTQGAAATFARSDHTHAIASGLPSSQTPNQTNATGTSANFARADHIHDIPTAAPANQTIAASASDGVAATFSRSDHLHTFSTAAPSNQTIAASASDGTSTSFSRSDHLHTFSTAAASSLTPNLANAVGTSTSFARADHIHNVPTAAPANQTIAASASDGVAATFSRSDHLHTFSTAAPSSQTPDQANAVGTSTSFARADHVHNIPTAAASGLNANSTSTQGAAATFARSDHTHAIASGTVSTQTPDQANAAGTSTNFARADHIHNIPTAVASSLTTASTSTQGAAATFARSDHTHAITINSVQVTAAAGTTTTGGTDTLVTGMTSTPAAGVYFVTFTSSVVNSANGAQRTFASLYFNGVQQTNSEIAIGTAGGAYSPVTLQDIITTNGTNAVEVRARVAGGTSTWYQMTLTLVRLSN